MTNEFSLYPQTKEELVLLMEARKQEWREHDRVAADLPGRQNRIVYEDAKNDVFYALSAETQPSGLSRLFSPKKFTAEKESFLSKAQEKAADEIKCYTQVAPIFGMNVPAQFSHVVMADAAVTHSILPQPAKLLSVLATSRVPGVSVDKILFDSRVSDHKKRNLFQKATNEAIIYGSLSGDPDRCNLTNQFVEDPTAEDPKITHIDFEMADEDAPCSVILERMLQIGFCLTNGLVLENLPAQFALAGRQLIASPLKIPVADKQRYGNRIMEALEVFGPM